MKRLAAILLALTSACASSLDRAPRAGDEPDGPYVLVLGTAQDGGIPQIGCRDAPCERARADARLRRFVASLLLVDPAAGTRYLVDATPDLAEQIELARGVPAGRAVEGPRPALVDGIILTHAHWGHYAGLAELGREVYGARGVRVLASARMGGFLRANGPWSLLVHSGAIEIEEIRPERAVRLEETLSVRPIRVPHREEFSDVFAFMIEGPARKLLYVPDADRWERWESSIEDLLREADVALVDGTFFGRAEIPGRSLAEIPHPTISASLERFAPLPESERAKILFTHLNHTNPAADPTSDATRAIRAAGMDVARDGMRFAL
jgi:pyrroloquinoline quinone biosynthesis protein B